MLNLEEVIAQRHGPMVIFLGAGAAVADGLPSTDKVTEEIRDFLIEDRITYSLLFKEDRTLFEEFYVQHTRTHPPSLDNFLGKPNGESLMKLFSDIWTYLQRHKECAPAARYFDLLITFLTEGAAVSTDKSTLGVKGYRSKLLSRIYEQGGEICIITTNWDTSLDTIVRIIAGRDKSTQGVVNYGIYIQDSGNNEKASSHQIIHFYKVNGSADWFFCNSCKSVARIEQHRIFSTSRHRDAARMVLCRGCGRTMYRFMIMPTLVREGGSAMAHPFFDPDPPAVISMKKHLSLAKLSTVPTQAWDALRKAQTILFVGYSLPTYDAPVRDCISTALDQNRFVQEGSCAITVVAKDEASQITNRNFSELFGAIGFHYCNSGLDQFLANKES